VRNLAKVGDILEYEKPIYEYHQKELDRGAYYVVIQDPRKKIWQDENEVWHVEDLPQLDKKQIMLQMPNGCEVVGYLKDYPYYKIVGNVKKLKKLNAKENGT